jgi:hypothetical protein
LEEFLIQLGNWGKKYRGDFIAGAIAFILPFFINMAFRGFLDPVSIASFIGVVFTLLVLIASSERGTTSLLRRWRKKKFMTPVNVGILSGYLTPEEKTNIPNSPYSDFTPEQWFNAISNHKEFNVDWVSASEISRKFDIIINPFGEEYPEINKPNLLTLRKIVQYVKNGGIFVNVAGLAFYYLWDGKEEDLSGPLLETYQLNPKNLILERKVFLRASHLLDSSLHKYFGLRTTMFDATILSVKAVADEFFNQLATVGGESKVKEFRSAFRSEMEEAFLIPILEAEYIIMDAHEKKMIFSCYPISVTEFGKGYLVLNGMKLEKSRPQDFEKAVEAIKCITHKLKLKGALV